MLQEYCVYFSVSRGERAEYNHWVCFVRLRMIEDWLFVMNPVPLPPLVPKNVFASPSSLCFLYVRLILNCERIAIKSKVCCTAVPGIAYQVYHTKYQVSCSSIIHSRSGVTDVGLLYHTRSLAVRVLSLSSFLVSRTLSGSLFASPSSLFFLYQVCTSHSELRTYSLSLIHI